MSEEQEESAAIWIGLLIENGLRARAGHPASPKVRLALAGSPSRLHDLALVEALLA